MEGEGRVARRFVRSCGNNYVPPPWTDNLDPKGPNVPKTLCLHWDSCPVSGHITVLPYSTLDTTYLRIRFHPDCLLVQSAQ